MGRFEKEERGEKGERREKRGKKGAEPNPNSERKCKFQNKNVELFVSLFIFLFSCEEEKQAK